MNKARREAISKVLDKLNEIGLDLSQVRDEEQEAYDNMPESLQNSEKGNMMEENIDVLDSAIYSLEEIYDQLGDL